MGHTVRAGLALVLGLVVGLSSVKGQEAASSLRLRDYVRTEWTQRDGMPLSEIGRILQTSDGRLWVTTSADGLLSFDGIRFVQGPLPCFRRLNNPSPSPDGGFWGTCGRDLVQNLIHRTPAGEFVETPHAFARDTQSRFLFVDRQGRLVFAGESIRYLKAPEFEIREMRRPTTAAIDYAIDDADGALWVAGPDQIFRIDDSTQDEFALRYAGCLTPAGQGGILAATDDRIWHLRGRSMRAIVAAPEGVHFAAHQGCMIDAGGDGIWIGTRQHGVARIQNGRVETLLDGNGRLVTQVFLDSYRQIWVGTTSGLQRFRRPMVQFAQSASSLLGTPNFVFADASDGLWISPIERKPIRTAPNGDRRFVNPVRGIFVAIGEDADGRFWLSDRSDIGYVDGDRFVAVRDSANAPIAGVMSFRSTGDQLWAVAQGSGVYRVAPGRPELVVKSDRAFDRFLVSERSGTWISLRGGGLEQHIDGRVNLFQSQAGGKMEDVRTIIEDGDSIWIGTFGGLRRWRGGQWTEWTAAHGLPGDNGAVDEITTDNYGRFWFMTRGGILMLLREQFDATPDGMPRTLSFARIGVLDGVVPHRGNLRNWPRVTRDRRGRLFFTTMDAVVMVDPADLTTSLAPPILIESVVVDRQMIDPQTTRRFVEPSRLQFEYTSLDLRSPEYARFRYRLEGYDAGWIEAGTERRVTYGTMQPGAYTFRVIGAGSEGVWNDTGASFAFHIVPVFWRTWWFRLTMLALCGFVVAALHRVRVRQLTRQFNLGVEARVSERTRIARDLHDTLLQSFQGVLIHFQAATNLLPGRPDDAKRKLDGVLDHAARAITEARDAVQGLRAPAGDDDLAKTIGVLGDELTAEPGDTGSTTIHVNVEGQPRNLRPVMRDDIYRIASEALRNAIRHAQAHAIQVDIHYGERALQVRIRDDGKGIDPKMLEERGAAGHWGLPGMRERAELIGGTLEVRSRLGSGTEIDLSVPAAKAYDAPAGARRFWFRKTTTGTGQ